MEYFCVNNTKKFVFQRRMQHVALQAYKVRCSYMSSKSELGKFKFIYISNLKGLWEIRNHTEYIGEGNLNDLVTDIVAMKSFFGIANIPGDYLFSDIWVFVMSVCDDSIVATKWLYIGNVCSVSVLYHLITYVYAHVYSILVSFCILVGLKIKGNLCGVSVE